MSLFKWGDIFIFIALFSVLIISLVTAVPKSSGTAVDIYYHDSLVKTAPFMTDTFMIVHESAEMVVAITDSSVAVESSNCPAGICVRSHPIESGGEEIICVPNRIVVKVRGDEERGIDAISR